MTRRYETVYIFDSTLNEEQVNGHLARFHALLSTPERPEPVTQVSHWGKRSLAYPIKGRDTGYYVVVQFEAPTTVLKEFERAVKLEEGVIRHLLVLVEGEQPRPASARRFGDAEAPEAAEVEE